MLERDGLVLEPEFIAGDAALALGLTRCFVGDSRQLALLTADDAASVRSFFEVEAPKNFYEVSAPTHLLSVVWERKLFSPIFRSKSRLQVYLILQRSVIPLGMKYSGS